MANSVDLDETARHESSHLDLHCLQKYLYWTAGMKGLTSIHYPIQRICMLGLVLMHT